MANHVTVHKRRTNVLQVSLGIDISADILTSVIREQDNADSAQIAEWTVTMATDGSDGELVLTLDDTDASTAEVLAASKGYMDLKRVSGGEPISVFEDVVLVRFKDVVTT